MTGAARTALLAAGALIALCVLSALSTALYTLLAGTGWESFKPWGIIKVLSAAKTQEIQSRLFVAIGLPVIALMATLAKIFGEEDSDNAASRWAQHQDIRKAGLLKNQGIILGKYKGRYLINDDPTHILCIAPTRSGKGVGLVVPNLLNWPGSLICLDLKHENHRITAGYRQKCGQDVFMWAPQDMHSHCYNPFDALSKNPHQKVTDLKLIAWILIPDPKYGDDFWVSEARSLFVGLALYVLENKEMPSTIGAVNRLLGAEADLGDICRHLTKTRKELPTAAKKTLMSFANKAAKERSGVKSSLAEALQLWDTPAIDAATARSDFSLSDLRKKRISVYVGVHTGQIANLAPLLRIFFEQAIALLSLREPDESEPHKVLLMMDEFHMLGEMKAMSTAFTLLGGFNCRVMAVVQGLKWLDVVYGRDKRDGILSCCAHQVFFSANDLETAGYISASCGDKKVKSVSTSQKKSLRYEPPSHNISTRTAPLISKEKARRMAKHEQIIITEASYPVRARKLVYYQDKNFLSRLLAPPHVPALKINDHAIPEFDIPAQQTENIPAPDPNQINMFDQTTKTDQNTLTDELKQPDDESDDSEKSGSLITQLLSRLDDEID